MAFINLSGFCSMILNIFSHPGHIPNLFAIMYFYSLIKAIVLTVIKDYKLDIFLFTVSEFIVFHFRKVSESLIFIFLNNVVKYFPLYMQMSVWCAHVYCCTWLCVSMWQMEVNTGVFTH